VGTHSEETFYPQRTQRGTEDFGNLIQRLPWSLALDSAACFLRGVLLL
jgi:hypothetical protein